MMKYAKSILCVAASTISLQAFADQAQQVTIPGYEGAAQENSTATMAPTNVPPKAPGEVIKPGTAPVPPTTPTNQPPQAPSAPGAAPPSGPPEEKAETQQPPQGTPMPPQAPPQGMMTQPPPGAAPQGAMTQTPQGVPPQGPQGKIMPPSAPPNGNMNPSNQPPMPNQSYNQMNQMQLNKKISDNIAAAIADSQKRNQGFQQRS